LQQRGPEPNQLDSGTEKFWALDCHGGVFLRILCLVGWGLHNSPYGGVVAYVVAPLVVRVVGGASEIR